MSLYFYNTYILKLSERAKTRKINLRHKNSLVINVTRIGEINITLSQPRKFTRFDCKEVTRVILSSN